MTTTTMTKVGLLAGGPFMWLLYDSVTIWCIDKDVLCRTFVKTWKEWKGSGCWIQSKGMPNDWVTEWMRDRVTERLSDWIMSDWVTDWVTDWIMSNWVNEGMSDWLIDCVTDSWTISFISVTCVLQAELHCSIILRQREWLCLFNKIHLLFNVRKIMRRENLFWHLYLCLETTTNYFAELRRLKELSNVKKCLCYLSTESGRWREEEGKAWSVCLRTTPVKYA